MFPIFSFSRVLLFSYVKHFKPSIPNIKSKFSCSCILCSPELENAVFFVEISLKILSEHLFPFEVWVLREGRKTNREHLSRGWRPCTVHPCLQALPLASLFWSRSCNPVQLHVFVPLEDWLLKGNTVNCFVWVINHTV